MLPGSASPSSRAATFTPSPRMSSPSHTMSPRLMPMRYRRRRSSDRAAWSAASASCTATAHSTAATTLGNSTSTPSPIFLTMRPPYVAMLGSMIAPSQVFWRAIVPTSSARISRE